MPILASLLMLAAVQSAEEIDDALRRLAHEDIVERQTGAQRLSSIAPAILDAVLQIDPARRKASPATASRLDRLQQALSDGLPALLPPGAPEEPFGLPDLMPEDEDILEKLRTIRIGVERMEGPITAVIDYARDISGLNIHLQVPEPDRIIVAFQAEETSAEDFLTRLLKTQGWTFLVRDGVVLIRTLEAARKQVHLELYDVQDLTYSMDHPGVDIQLALQPPAPEAEPEEMFTGEDLANLVKAATPSEAWEEADGLSIQFQNGLLIVRNTREIHTDIRRFLFHLRMLRMRKQPGSENFYADLERAEKRVGELIEALRLARRGLVRQEAAEDVELRLRSRDLRQAMDVELSLAGLRLLLGQSNH